MCVCVCVCVCVVRVFLCQQCLFKPHPQVFNRLQRLQLCVSYAALLNVLESADGHDEKVTEWQETLKECAIPNQKNVRVILDMFILSCRARLKLELTERNLTASSRPVHSISA